MTKLELLWGFLGLLFVFYPRSVSFYSYFLVQYEYLLYSGCYFMIWFCLIFKRNLDVGQEKVTSWRWMDSFFVLLMLYLFVCACVNFKENGFIILQLGVAILGYYCFRNIPKNHFVWYVVAFWVAGGIQVIYSLYTQADYFLLSEKWSRIYGSFLNTSVWGNYLALLLMMSLGLIVWVKKQYLLLLLLLCISLGLLLLQSDSRTGWLAVLIGLTGGAYWMYLSKGRIRLKKVHLLLTILSLSLFISVLCYTFYLYKKDSGDGRLLVWRVSYEMVKDAPLLGHGVNGFRQNYMYYQASFFKKHPMHKWRMLADDSSFTFNEYIRFIVEHGTIAGFLFFSLCLYVLLKRTNNKEPKVALSKILLLSWGIVAFFSYPFFMWQFVVILLFIVAGIGGGDIIYVLHKNGFIRNVYRFGLLVWVGIMLGGGVLYGKKTQMLFNQGKNLYAARNYTGAKDALKCSFIYFPDYNTAMLIGEVYDELQRSDSAEYYWRMASDMIPYRVVPHFRLFKLYQKTDIEKAYREALQIRNMPVKVYAPHLNEIYKEVDDFLKDYCFHCFS